MTPTGLLDWALAHAELAMTVGTMLGGVLGAGQHYRRTGRVPLSALPWRAFRRLFYVARRHLFTVRRPDQTPVVLEDTTIEDVRTRLGRESFTLGFPLSYHYYGEDVNASRYYYDPTAEYPHRRMHARGFRAGSTVQVLTHDEPDPWHHPFAHIKEVDVHDATTWFREAWRSPALDPRTFDRSQTDGN